MIVAIALGSAAIRVFGCTRRRAFVRGSVPRRLSLDLAAVATNRLKKQRGRVSRNRATA